MAEGVSAIYLRLHFNINILSQELCGVPCFHPQHPNGIILPELAGQGSALCPDNSDINLFCNCQGIIYFDAEISNGAFDFRVTKKDLHRSYIARASVNQGRFGSA